MEQLQEKKINKKRVYSLDMSRGFIVMLSVFLSTIPYGGYEYLRHADWYGVTIIDLILPSFITIFGTSMAIAYQRGVSWEKIIKRTIRLVIYGLLFTIIVSWSFDLSNMRFTGVLQMFAFLGISAVFITRFIKSPLQLILSALFLWSLYGGILLHAAQSCEGGLPQEQCNLSGPIDGAIFGENHIYQQGQRGFDPEGMVTSFAALGNVLMGYAIGRLILTRKETGAWKELLVLGAVLILFSLIWDHFLPFNKRMWTPAFAMLAAGTVSIMISVFYLIFDKREVDAKHTGLKPFVWFLEAYGRNSFLIYFGKFIIAAVLTHVTITADARTLNSYLLEWVYTLSPFPQITYALIMLLFWTIVAMVLHKKGRYIKV